MAAIEKIALEEHFLDPAQDACLQMLTGDPDIFASPATKPLMSLFFLSVDVLLAWCREAPEIAPEFIVSVAQPLVRTGENFETWNPIILAILDEFGTNNRVLTALARNIGTFSNWGSLVPYYNRFVGPFETLASHSVPSVKRWSRKMLAAYRKMIEDETKRDEEFKIGIY